MTNHMIALFVAPADRQRLLDLLPDNLKQYAQPDTSLHLTLWTWEAEDTDVDSTLLSLSGVDLNFLPITGKIQGWGVFEQGEKRVLYASFDHTELPTLRTRVWEQEMFVPGGGIMAFPDHGFTPHITLAYLPGDAVIPDLKVTPYELSFDRLYLAVDDQVYSNGVIPGVQELNMEKAQETPFELCKSVTELPDGNLEIIVKGVPFYGPDYLNGRDIDGEYFSKSTDIGGLPQVLGTFHHGKDPVYGKGLVGGAFLMSDAEVTEKGLDPEEAYFYRYVVDKNSRYKTALKMLAAKNYLGASSTPFQRTAQKSADGHWDVWHVVEMTLTYQQSNPDAEIIFQKSIGDEFMTAKKPGAGTQLSDALPVAVPPEVPAATEDQKSAPEAVNEIVAAIEEAFKPEVVVLEIGTEKSGYPSAILVEILTLLKGLEARQVVTEKSIGDITVAIPLLAVKMAGKVTAALALEKAKSEPERIAEAAVRTATSHVDSKLPADAPGNQ